MTEGICKALSKALEYVGDVNKITLERNGMSDAQFATILSKMGNFRKIVYKKNRLGEKSLEKLIPLIQRSYLEELKIEGCQLTRGVLEELLEKIYDKNFLNTLSLVSLKMSEESLATLCNFVKTS